MRLKLLSACIFTAFLVGCASHCPVEKPPEAQEAQDEAEEPSFAESLWWTWKYAMWGQGSSKDWPWAW